MNNITSDRLIGRKEILQIMESLYRIKSWSGARSKIAREGLPLHRIGDKPMMYIMEIVEHEVNNGRIVCLNNLTIV